MENTSKQAASVAQRTRHSAEPGRAGDSRRYAGVDYLDLASPETESTSNSNRQFLRLCRHQNLLCVCRLFSREAPATGAAQKLAAPPFATDPAVCCVARRR